MRDTRTYDDLGAALCAMPHESRELTLTLLQIVLFELAFPQSLIVGGDAGEAADRVVEKLAERFDRIADHETQLTKSRAAIDRVQELADDLSIAADFVDGVMVSCTAIAASLRAALDGA